MEIVGISSAALARIRAAAAASPAREVCGLLFGSRGWIERAAPGANVHVDPARAFELDPAALLVAHRAQRAGGPTIVGHFHSHPSGAARPSAADLAASVPGQLWLIAAAGEVRAWRARAGGFDEVTLQAG